MSGKKGLIRNQSIGFLNKGSLREHVYHKAKNNPQSQPELLHS